MKSAKRQEARGVWQHLNADEALKISGMSTEKASEGVTVRTARKPPDDWDRAARRVIEAELLKAECSYTKLLERLGALGYDETQLKHLAQRIQRGGFSFAFALRVLKVLGVEKLDISYIYQYKREKSGPRRR